MSADPKPVAGIVTEYSQNSDADLILGRILDGYNFEGKDKPELKLASLFTDQVRPNDWSRAVAKKHDLVIYDSIEGSLKRGTPSVAVHGVICIGEQGDYPTNEKEQRLYPRRRFFEQVTDVFQKLGRVVPVFNDNQLAHNWADAKWMYKRAAELMVPVMAGSTLPLTWRDPPLVLKQGCRIREALAVGYGAIESSGFQALDMLQCMVERRHGGESGVTRVQCVEGRGVWAAVRQSEYFNKLFDAAIASCAASKPGPPEVNCGDAAAAFLLDYCDGLRATVLLLNGHAQQFSFAARLGGINRGPGISLGIAACQFYRQPSRPFGHFSHLVHAIEGMVQTGHSLYPVERTLLTTGILDELMSSRNDNHRPRRTPHLVGLSYDAVDYPFARGPIPS